MPLYDYALVAAGWLIWFAPFPLNRWNFRAPDKIARAARWGIVLQLLAYSVLWQSDFWARSPGVWRTVASVVFLALAGVLSWTATRALGRHLRLDAAINPGHQLVRSGPYRILRHPIYTSMLCMVLGTGFLVATIPLLLLGALAFVAGTEVRVQTEDRLLASHFGEAFLEYQRTVSAYIPLLR